MRFFVTITAIFLGFAHPAKSAEAPPELEATAKEVVQSLIKGERAELARFMVKESSLENDDDFYDFLYKGDLLHRQGLRSIREIIELGETKHRIDMADNGTEATVYFYPKQYEQRVKQGRLRPIFMKLFFACKFALTEKGWRMPLTFCLYGIDF